MTPNKPVSVDEILDKFVPTIQDGEQWIAEAKHQLHQALRAAMPEKKDPEMRATHHITMTSGYNQAIDEALAAIDRVFGVKGK